MKLVLNRNEVLEIKKLISTMGDICGDDVSRVMEEVDKQVTTKKCIMTMITGQFTLEIREEFIIGLLNITNNLAKESAPVLKACVSLCQALVPTFTKYNSQYKDFFNQYEEIEVTQASDKWSIQSITTEQVKEVV